MLFQYLIFLGDSFSTTDTLFEKTVIKQLVYNKNLIEAIDKKIIKLAEDLQTLIRITDGKGELNSTNTTDDIFKQLPVKSIKEFDEMSSILQKQEIFDFLVS